MKNLSSTSSYFLIPTTNKQQNSHVVQRTLKFWLAAPTGIPSFDVILFYPLWIFLYVSLHRLLWVTLKVLMAGLASVVAELLLKKDTTLPFTVHLGQPKSSLPWYNVTIDFVIPMVKAKKTIVVPAFFTT